ncbi:MAG: PKD domain-containing protein [Pseudomonadota bacterium]
MNLIMKSQMSKKLFLVLTVLAMLLLPLLGGANAGVFYVSPGLYYVPNDSYLIQQAIDEAQPGSTVVVGPGFYWGSLHITKPITLRSKEGADVTTIRGNGTSWQLTPLSAGVIITQCNGAVLDGFTITNEWNPDSGVSCSEMGGGWTNVKGGVWCYKSTKTTIKNCIITRNYGGSSGGIVCELASPVIKDCVISSNGGEVVGGIYCVNSSPTITNCLISNNYGCSAGAIACLNATKRHWMARGDDDVTSYCENGGYACLTSCSPKLINCTVGKNETLSLASAGGICFYSGAFPGVSLSMVNSIVWGNKTPNNTLQIYSYDSTGTFNIAYSNIQTTHVRDKRIFAAQVSGNISRDPEFTDTDLHLDKSSPCIDAGSNDVADLPVCDIDGNPRIINGNGDGRAVVDMGASETGAYDPYLLVANFSVNPPAGSVKLNQYARIQVLELLTVQFADTSTGTVTTRLWNFGDGKTSSEQNPWHAYNKKGDYTVSLTVTGPNGADTRAVQYCIHVTDVPKIMQVFPNPIKPGATLSIVGSVLDDPKNSKGELELYPGNTKIDAVTIGDVTLRRGDPNVLSWSDCMIKVKAPSFNFGSSASIKKNVSVTVNEFYQSNNLSLTISKP